MCSLFSTIRYCDTALACLDTVSEGVIRDVQMVLQKICSDSSSESQVLLQNGVAGYTKHPLRPINRYSDAIRSKIEPHMDMILRADHGASDGVNICRAYSPEINTQEKLRAVLGRHLEAEEFENMHISNRSLQRMKDEHLELQNSSIKLTQSDPNACPLCKTLKDALLQLIFEFNSVARELERIRFLSQPLRRSDFEKNSKHLGMPWVQSSIRNKVPLTNYFGTTRGMR